MTNEEYRCGRINHWYTTKTWADSDERLLERALFIQKECSHAGGCEGIKACQIRDLIQELQAKKDQP